MCKYTLCVSMHKLSANVKRTLQKHLQFNNTVSCRVCVSTEAMGLLVDTACHVFNVFGFVLQATVVVVSLHTRLYFTADGSPQLSTKRAFLHKGWPGTELFLMLHHM